MAVPRKFLYAIAMSGEYETVSPFAQQLQNRVLYCGTVITVPYSYTSNQNFRFFLPFPLIDSCF